VHQVDLTAESGISWNGYRLTVACSCGVTFERLITPWDAELDLLRLARLATRGNVHSSVANRCGARRIRLGANWVQRCPALGPSERVTRAAISIRLGDTAIPGDRRHPGGRADTGGVRHCSDVALKRPFHGHSVRREHRADGAPLMLA
jgi:hypothetical protein